MATNSSVASHIVRDFTSGFLKALDMYTRSDATWGAIRAAAQTFPESFGAGMLSACEALEGSMAAARAEAALYGVPKARIEALIERSLEA
jgi:hypothetical protein